MNYFDNLEILLSSKATAITILLFLLSNFADVFFVIAVSALASPYITKITREWRNIFLLVLVIIAFFSMSFAMLPFILFAIAREWKNRISILKEWKRVSLFFGILTILTWLTYQMFAGLSYVHLLPFVFSDKAPTELTYVDVGFRQTNDGKERILYTFNNEFRHVNSKKIVLTDLKSIDELIVTYTPIFGGEIIYLNLKKFSSLFFFFALLFTISTFFLTRKLIPSNSKRADFVMSTLISYLMLFSTALSLPFRFFFNHIVSLISF